MAQIPYIIPIKNENFTDSPVLLAFLFFIYLYFLNIAYLYYIYVTSGTTGSLNFYFVKYSSLALSCKYTFVYLFDVFLYSLYPSSIQVSHAVLGIVIANIW